MGLQEYCLYRDRREDNLFQKKDVRDFLRYSFRHKDFPMNQRQIEPFESPKLLGDIFESVIGAVYEDSGLDEVHRVFRHLLSPLILFNTQFSKLSALYGEPKEQFNWKCNECKIKPKYVNHEVPVLRTIVRQQILGSQDTILRVLDTVEPGSCTP